MAALSLEFLDQELLARIRAGDAAAFETMYRSHAPMLWRVAYSYLKSRVEAEDAVQNVFLRLWAKREKWVVQGRLEVYLYGAVRNEALQILRHERVVERVTVEDDNDTPPPSDLETEDRNNAISKAIAQLPERQRLAITLRYIHGLGYQDIADILNVAVSHAHKQVALGERLLRRFLKEFGS